MTNNLKSASILLTDVKEQQKFLEFKTNRIVQIGVSPLCTLHFLSLRGDKCNNINIYIMFNIMQSSTIALQYIQPL